MNREELLIKFAVIKDTVNQGMLYATTTEELYKVLSAVDAALTEVFEIEDHVNAVYEES